MRKISSPVELQKLREDITSKRDPSKMCIVTSVGTCGLARGAEKVAKAISEEIQHRGLGKDVSLRTTGCHGFCEIEPVVVIYPERILYCHVRPEDVGDIFSESVVGNNLVERLLYTEPSTGEKIVHEHDLPFYKKQNRLLLDPNRLIDPHSIEDYLAIGGYSALAKALFQITPDEVIDEVEKAGLRGRGGGGFPTGRKWRLCRKSPGDRKYLICNGDEGDPGAFMDRSIMEGNPHALLEGMVIGSYAIGTHEAIIYVRSEYPLAVANLTTAISQAKEYGLLGDSILGGKHNLDIRIFMGAGAFVCGEETALIASIEGRPGTPRQRPPFPAESGLNGCPTNINNVETWANVPVIIDRGSDWFASIGTKGSKGTKVFSLVGKVENTGLVEVPMGITLREVVYDIGGGVKNGRKLKAVQTGGPSGGAIPSSMVDLHIDFDELTAHGSMMGSGGLIVMDDVTCMVDVARYFVNFLAEESCGKCTPCREGLDRMLDILTRITEGKGKQEDIELLQELALYVSRASLCGLGQTSANPVLASLKYFGDEYQAHIVDRKCPAGVCRALIEYYIDESMCIGCGLCLKACPQGAISGEKGQLHCIDPKKCTKCGICFETCKKEAVAKK